MMLSSFAHGSAKLRIADQFPPDEDGLVYSVEEVIPAFTYRSGD